MPLFKERGHSWFWNEVYLLEIFCWIKPKSKSDIWAQSNRKAMLDARLLCLLIEKKQKTNAHQTFIEFIFFKIILFCFLYKKMDPIMLCVVCMKQKLPDTHHNKLQLVYFFPIFHWSLYCRSIYTPEGLIFYDFFYLTLKSKDNNQFTS